jgi:hypothetical protein
MAVSDYFLIFFEVLRVSLELATRDRRVAKAKWLSGALLVQLQIHKCLHSVSIAYPAYHELTWFSLGTCTMVQ